MGCIHVLVSQHSCQVDIVPASMTWPAKARCWALAKIDLDRDKGADLWFQSYLKLTDCTAWLQ